MAKAVFILGAGASAQDGAPVMADFLDVSERLLAERAVDPYRKQFEMVFKGIHRLQSVFAKSYLDIENLESVFMAFEMAQLLGKLQDDSKDADDLPAALRQVIVRTLEQTLRFPVDANGNVSPTYHHGRFGKYIAKTLKAGAHPVSIITFNYDCALDYALCHEQVQIDYGLSESAVSHPAAARVLKLHGSLNWAGAPRGSIAVSALKPISTSAHLTSRFKTEITHSLQITDAAVRAAAQAAPNEEINPIIVPPSGSKGEHHRRLESVWRAAATELSEAEIIVVVGYSLPITDEFFRYLFALGTISPVRLKHVWVCDAHPSAPLDARFRALLGPMAASRYKLAKWSFSGVAQDLDGGGLEALQGRMGAGISFG